VTNRASDYENNSDIEIKTGLWDELNH